MSYTRKILLGGVIYIVLMNLYGCLSSQKVSDRIIAGAQSLKPFDAIIVPGIPFKNYKWDSIMKGRVIWAYILYRNGYTKNVIFSGSSVYSPFFESKIMGLYAQKLGIPKEHIFYENKARHSTENVYYSYLLAKKLGFKSLALATDPFQSWMLQSFTRRRFATPIYHMPFIVDTLKQYNGLNPEIDPEPARAEENYSSITDQQTIWRRFKGTLGKDIDWSKHKDGKVESL